MPYIPRFRLTSALLSDVVEITHSLSWIAYMSQHFSHVSLWVEKTQAEIKATSAYYSTLIEGNNNPVEFEREQSNYTEALNWVSVNKDLNAFTEKNICHLHALITKNCLGTGKEGVYKTKKNRVVDARGITVYTPPHPNHTPTLMSDLVMWVLEAGKEKLHPIIMNAIVHHQLVSIHPFSDGNGRVSRAVGTWVMQLYGFDTAALMSIDKFFEEQRHTYYEKIQQARDLDNDLTCWIEYVVACAKKAVNDTKTHLERWIDDQKNTRSIELSIRQKELLTYLKHKQDVRSPDLQKVFKITRARVNQLMLPLIKEGLVIRKGQRRSTAYNLVSSS